GLHVRLAQPDVAEAVPLEHDETGGDIYALDNRVEHGHALATAMDQHGHVDRDPGGVALVDGELVEVRGVAVAGPDTGEHPVGTVGDYVLAEAEPEERKAPLPPGEGRR